MPKTTLACKTADLLALAINAINHVTSPGQHALLSADERKSTLQQLTTALRAAEKLAEVVHLEALTAQNGEAGTGRSDTGGLVVEKIIRAETYRAVAETQRLKAEAGKVEKEAARAVAETERLKAEVKMARSEKIKIDAETGRAKAGTGGRRTMAEAESRTEFQARQEAESKRKKAKKAKADAQTKLEAEGKGKNATVELLAMPKARPKARQEAEAENKTKHVKETFSAKWNVEAQENLEAKDKARRDTKGANSRTRTLRY